MERSLLKPPATWQAYEFYMRAADALDTFFSSSFVVEELYEARRLLERSQWTLSPGATTRVVAL
jgi:adenylate cyclase